MDYSDQCEFYFFHFITSERILSTLSKVQLILDELLTIFTTHVKIYLNINFHEERILSTLSKVNQLLILIERCLACQNLLEY
ncbi:unnamed protein product [Rhizophagus irregularis]|nr:unnamed protein product [Rhizophagus irregularis]